MRTQNNVFSEDVLIPYFGMYSFLVGVDIGGSGGIESIGMLSRLPNLKLYCIDPWIHTDLAPYEAGLPQEVHDAGYEQAKDKLFPYMDRVTIIRKKSDDAILDISNELNFVFIDGHHEYYQVINDIKNYLPKIKNGGLISGHDYGQVPDVTKAVNEIFTDKTINTAEDFIWWVKL